MDVVCGYGCGVHGCVNVGMCGCGGVWVWMCDVEVWVCGCGGVCVDVWCRGVGVWCVGMDVACGYGWMWCVGMDVVCMGV